MTVINSAIKINRIGFLREQWLMRIMAGFLTINLSLLYACDPRDIMTDGGVLGPYSLSSSGQISTPITTIYAGETFGWISKLCLKPGVTMLAHIDLVELSTNKIYDAWTKRYNAGDRDCGPLIGKMSISSDLPPGHYSIKRYVILNPEKWLHMKVYLESINIDVIYHNSSDNEQINGH